jgi:hypothetical protein
MQPYCLCYGSFFKNCTLNWLVFKNTGGVVCEVAMDIYTLLGQYQASAVKYLQLEQNEFNDFPCLPN